MNVKDIYQNGRGTALSDILYRGRLDILNGNWEVLTEPTF